MTRSPSSPDQARPAASGRNRTGKAKRYLVAAALLGGGVTMGAILGPVGFAGAQSDSGDNADSTVDGRSTDEPTDRTDGDGREGRRDHRHRGRGGIERFMEIVGLTPEELRSRFEEGRTPAEIAADQGISVDELVAEMLAPMEQRLAEAVEAGRIEAAEAEERLAEAQRRVTEFVNRSPAELGDRGHHHHHHHHHHHRGPGGAFGRAGFGEVLESLGITGEEVRAGRSEGKSLAEIAEEQGVDQQELVDRLVAAAVAAVDEAVEAGEIDADRAAEIEDGIDERISAMVERSPRDHPRWNSERRPGLGHRSGPGDVTDGDTEDTAFTA